MSTSPQFVSKRDTAKVCQAWKGRWVLGLLSGIFPGLHEGWKSQKCMDGRNQALSNRHDPRAQAQLPTLFRMCQQRPHRDSSGCTACAWQLQAQGPPPTHTHTHSAVPRTEATCQVSLHSIGPSSQESCLRPTGPHSACPWRHGSYVRVACSPRGCSTCSLLHDYAVHTQFGQR